MKRITTTFFKTHWVKIFSVFFFVALSISYINTFAVYAPGQTLDPTCAPGDSGCYVSSGGSGSFSGASGGQTLYGGTASAENLTISSTSNATKGKIIFGTSAYDEANNRLGIGTVTPGATLVVNGDSLLSGTSRYLNFNTTVGTSGYGIRDNAGAMEFKNNAGTWAAIGESVIRYIGTSYVGQTSGPGSNGTDGSTANNVFLGNGAGSDLTSVQLSNFIGSNSGRSAASASGSNFIGNNSGNNASSSINSNFIGNSAGDGASNSSHSNFIGRQAGYGATNVSYSNLIGYHAGQAFPSNNIGSNNIIIGTNISLPNTSADSINIGGILFGAGAYSTTTGDPLITGTSTGRIGIGSYTFDATNPEKLLVAAGTTTSVNLIKGTGSINSYLQLNVQNTSAGTSASSDVVATADNGNESSGYIDMGINSSGNTSAMWGAANDAYLYNMGAGSGGNLLIGTGSASKSLIFMTGGSAAGNERMRIDGTTSGVVIGGGTATASTALSVNGDTLLLGTSRYLNFNTTVGTSGYGIRDNAGAMEFKNNAGTWAAIGGSVIRFVNNSYVGQNSGPGSNGTSAGTGGGSLSNIFIGGGAGNGSVNVTGSIFLGSSAGNQAGGVGYSTFIGQNAGQQATNANYSLLLGYRAGFTFTSNNIGANNIIIGTNISLPDAATNSFNIGGVLFGAGTYFSTSGNPLITGTSTGRIGIGSYTFDATNPEKLLVAAGTTTSVNLIKGTGSINSYLQLNVQNTSAGTSASSDVVATADNGSESTGYIDMGINSSGNTSGAWGASNDAYLYNMGAGTGGDLYVGTGSASKSLIFMTGGSAAGNERMRINGSGNVGIGTTPSTRFHVKGDTGDTTVLRVETTGGNTCNFSTTAGTFSCASDIRLKHDISSISSSDALTKLATLNPVLYRYNWQLPTDPLVSGFIAQEFESTFPELVSTDAITGYKSLTYVPLIPYTVKAINELDVKIKGMTLLSVATLPGTENQTTFADKLSSWLANAGNKITRIFTGEVCLTDSDGTSECLNKAELHQLKQLLNGNQTPQQNPTPSPEPTPTPEPEITQEDTETTPVSDESSQSSSETSSESTVTE